MLFVLTAILVPRFVLNMINSVQSTASPVIIAPKFELVLAVGKLIAQFFASFTTVENPNAVVLNIRLEGM